MGLRVNISVPKLAPPPLRIIPLDFLITVVELQKAGSYPPLENS